MSEEKNIVNQNDESETSKVESIEGAAFSKLLSIAIKTLVR